MLNVNPWCGELITLGVVTPGGIVYHAVCWRRREEMLRVRRDSTVR